ncbi:hypothetical protein CDAR_605291 [Caerostris darwini]|uniref:Uncharacterized protein n=1 Tax=Caerostris darwini TaxID=1538125 RepID=A0AAV4NAN1_9ARAC|nr:hypothetical protein CDAR_605291 [Caerostris darwini]
MKYALPFEHHLWKTTGRCRLRIVKKERSLIVPAGRSDDKFFLFVHLFRLKLFVVRTDMIVLDGKKILEPWDWKMMASECVSLCEDCTC